MKRKIRKELIEWIVLIVIIGMIYMGGWHTEVIGRIQQMVLSTGIIKPNLIEENKEASFDFWIEDFNSNRIRFSEFEGEVVFVNFWATWCAPCVAEMPDIHALYKNCKENIRFVMISLDREEEKARAFIERKGFEFPVYFLRSNLPKTYSTRSIPTTYVIDKRGMIKVETHRMAKYNTEKFNQLLNDLFKAQ